MPLRNTSRTHLLLLFFRKTASVVLQRNPAEKTSMNFFGQALSTGRDTITKTKNGFHEQGTHVPLHQGSGAHSRAGATGGKNSARQRSQKCQILGSGSGTTPSTRANSSTVDAPTSSASSTEHRVREPPSVEYAAASGGAAPVR